MEIKRLKITFELPEASTDAITMMRQVSNSQLLLRLLIGIEVLGEPGVGKSNQISFCFSSFQFPFIGQSLYELVTIHLSF